LIGNCLSNSVSKTLYAPLPAISIRKIMFSKVNEKPEYN
jgi:hypothetical protein